MHIFIVLEESYIQALAIVKHKGRASRYVLFRTHFPQASINRH